MKLYARFSEKGLCELSTARPKTRPTPKGEKVVLPKKAHIKALEKWLAEYFNSGGKMKAKLPPLDLDSGTDFERKVWKALLEIPFGRASTYGTLATRIGKPKASRAVGRAVGKNPIFILVPCHRIIGSDRSLTGYAGGLPMKIKLLTHEQIAFKPNR